MQIAEKLNKADLPIIDIGAGASKLVESLVEMGFTDITALDIAQPGLDIAKARLGDKAQSVNWICGDIIDVKLPKKYALWHDRAAFHFLTEKELQRAYVVQLKQALLPNATILLATFAKNGPDKCSDLLVEQYDEQTLMQLLGEEFKLVNSQQKYHVTPAGNQQLFQHFELRFKPKND